jgi:hypothetical protein
MTSHKQIVANRRNALKSTGPRTEEGKQIASRNALRHGLTAETVVEMLEDRADYQAFEEAVAADFTAESAVERELVLRLASLLWRLRRATAIETDLMSMEGDILNERQHRPKRQSESSIALTTFFGLDQRVNSQAHRGERNHAKEIPGGQSFRLLEGKVAGRFVRLANEGHIERLSRYEMTLWRQVRQTLFTMEAMRWGNSHTLNRNSHFWRRGHNPEI